MLHFHEPIVIDVEHCTPSQAGDTAFVVRAEEFRTRRLSIVAGLLRAGQRFGAAHPTLIAIIGKIADGLSQLGI